MSATYQYALSLLFILFLGCTNAPKNNSLTIDNYADTTIEFDKLIHNFGQVQQGEIVGCYFKFTNTGENPLVINNVKPGCGCTTVNYPKKPILPGQKGEIEVRFDSRGFSGNQYKVIRVDANIEKKSKELALTASVIN